MHCYRHSRVETAVSCGKCDRPICPRCMIAGPAGMRCPDCASLRTTALYRIPPARLALAAIAGLVTGVAGAFVMSLPFFGFFVFFAGPFYGGVVAEAVLRAAGRKRGRALEVIGVGGIVLGAVVVCALPLVLATLAVHGVHPAPASGPGGDPGPPNPGAGRAVLSLGGGLFGLLWPLIGCGLAASACYARLKYL